MASFAIGLATTDTNWYWVVFPSMGNGVALYRMFISYGKMSATAEKIKIFLKAKEELLKRQEDK